MFIIGIALLAAGFLIGGIVQHFKRWPWRK
jgi:hypothetical protein